MNLFSEKRKNDNENMSVFRLEADAIGSCGEGTRRVRRGAPAQPKERTDFHQPRANCPPLAGNSASFARPGRSGRQFGLLRRGHRLVDAVLLQLGVDGLREA